METSKLVEQIAARVAEKLAIAEKTEEKSFRIARKAVTERMLADAYDNGYRIISIRPDSILTANAKELIHAYQIQIIRE